MDSRKLIRMLIQSGWELDRIEGSHHIFKKKDVNYPLPVPHPRKDLGKGLVGKILKLAGLK